MADVFISYAREDREGDEADVSLNAYDVCDLLAR
jgi:hypothetical protein